MTKQNELMLISRLVTVISLTSELLVMTVVVVLEMQVGSGSVLNLKKICMKFLPLVSAGLLTL